LYEKQVLDCVVRGEERPESDVDILVEFQHKAQEYTQGDRHYKSFIEDRKTVDAVVRNLIIIAEASIQIPDEVSLVSG